MPDSSLIDRYISLEWRKSDAKRLTAKIADCASQAVWEAYMALIAIFTWRHLLSRAAGTLELIGDAEGVLKAVLARRAKSPVVNSIIMEIQLMLGNTMHDLFASHVWTDDNGVADLLSRLSEGKPLPEECSKAFEDAVVMPNFKFLILKTESKQLTNVRLLS